MSDERLGLIQELYDDVNGGSLTLTRSHRLTDDVGLDSLEVVEVLAALEERLRVMLIGDRRLLNVTTVGELIDVLDELPAGTAR
jgi:acyl carrier protein